MNCWSGDLPLRNAFHFPFWISSSFGLAWGDDQLQAMADLASLPRGERVRVLGGKNFEKYAVSVQGGANP